jgi:hypothetical protein
VCFGQALCNVHQNCKFFVYNFSPEEEGEKEKEEYYHSL